ncbi:(deoxy)nucleoside triphosphate pyrophosphohydrolase [Rhodococcus sp. P1Y]|uniref:(deoxy)nucleoside triphosphate pyrophosphohydrolase n=1 Tax=Rhodococcus sp. P1Y TaxID=1302308 RepID=UPI000EB2B8B1|nr:(deoxy)nucleoside triphosphate pyrophosphohydrolase [Rhodococcus sp. P1Y]AYJ50856.1 (deoxy)nucleoside triphosphate pyrophosphohydrolase [Rhodococcus sp. P1Y]
MTGLVVAGALVVDGLLLLAQRARPPELAGLWELPGGKVEDGESPDAALERELREELGVETAVGEQLSGEVPVGNGLILRAYRVELISGTPVALDHSDIRWVDARTLGVMDLVDADRTWVPEIGSMLRQTGPS